MMRSDLAGLLIEDVCRQEIPLHYGKRLVRIGDGRGSGVIAYFADGSRAEGDILVGADGIHSEARRLVMPEAPAPEFVGIIGMGGAPAADGSARVSAHPHPELHLYVRTERLFRVLRREHRRRYVVVQPAAITTIQWR
jgi:2-polyprenyl-6-methoxyphenol hydroxylase-like FAD-dependent oxidoreductase